MEWVIYLGTYDGARAKTKLAIEQAFWEVYTEKGLRRVTVQEIADTAGIHRATFYMYFDSIDLVLESIKSRQLILLAEVLRVTRSPENGYEDFLKALEGLFEENRTYLEPLVCTFQDSDFAMEYRNILKEELRKDLGFPKYAAGTREHFMIDTILSAFIETLLQTLRTRLLPLQEAYRLVSGSVHNGVVSTLRDRFKMDIS